MITTKEVRHIQMLSKIINATQNVQEYSTVDLLIMKDAIEQELIRRGY